MFSKYFNLANETDNRYSDETVVNRRLFTEGQLTVKILNIGTCMFEQTV